EQGNSPYQMHLLPLLLVSLSPSLRLQGLVAIVPSLYARPPFVEHQNRPAPLHISRCRQIRWKHIPSTGDSSASTGVRDAYKNGGDIEPQFSNHLELRRRSARMHTNGSYTAAGTSCGGSIQGWHTQ